MNQQEFSNKCEQYLKMGKDYINFSKAMLEKFGTLNFTKNSLDNFQKIICLIVAKSVTTARCALRCAEKGYTIDALILLRSIYENRVNLLYLLQKERANRARRFSDFGEWQMRNDLKLRLQYPFKDQQAKEKIEKDIKKLDKICTKLKQKYKIERRWNYWSGINMKDLSDKVGLGDMYAVLYGDLSALIHGTAKSMHAYIEITQEGVNFKVGPSYLYMEKCLKYFCECMNDILYQFNTVFNLGLEKKHQEIESKFEKLVKL